MHEVERMIQSFRTPHINADYAYRMGYDCGKNGANTTNSHFAIFAKPENTKAWERGKRDAGAVTP